MSDMAGRRTDYYLIERIFNKMSSSVSIALMKRDRLCYEFYGGKYFNSENSDIRISRITRFNIGTATMPITGSLVVKLMEFGEVRLNDEVRRFLPEFKFPDITIFNLLTHTSGLYFTDLQQPHDYNSKKDFYRQLYNVRALSYKTGAESRLFPYGYAILADIIEGVTGQSLEEFASAILFLPLGMKSTTYSGTLLKDGQFIVPWSHKENRFLHELKSCLSTGFSGIYSTVLDLIRFGHMFLSGGEVNGRQVFLESSIDFMLREITNGRFMRTPIFMINSKNNKYDFFSGNQSSLTVAHTGDTGSLFYIDPSGRSVGAALTNSTWVNDSSSNYGSICEILSAM
ncbi:MAG: beta-lactamase family protein [Oscillospiraceae bacterium]|nr:beta-lactamase family protein [Oscillospiraceae bacterium]